MESKSYANLPIELIDELEKERRSMSPRPTKRSLLKFIVNKWLLDRGEESKNVEGI